MKKIVMYFLMALLVITLPGCSEPKEFTVEFVNEYDLGIEALVIVEGDLITEPEVGSVVGYTFNGWFKEATITLEFDFDTEISNDLILYAKWTEDIVVVEEFKIALITEAISDEILSYSHATWEGIVSYATDNSISHKYYIPTEDSLTAHMISIAEAIDNGAEIVVLPGYYFEEAAYEAQTQYPEIKFILIDGHPHDATLANWVITTNTTVVFFNEHEAGFLAGYSAAMEGYVDLGFTGGMAVPAVVKYGVGFIAGAYYAGEELGVTINFGDDTYTYFGSFYPGDVEKNIAAAWYTNGTELIFSAAGNAGAAIMAAAADQGKVVISSDFDKSSVSSTVLTSAVKNVEDVIYNVLEDYFSGSFDGGNSVFYGVSDTSVILPMDSSRFDVFTQAQYDAIYAKLVDGTIVVPSNYLELVTFLGDATGYPTQGKVEGIIN